MIQHSYQEKCPYCNPRVVDKAHEIALANQVEMDHDEARGEARERKNAKLYADMALRGARDYQSLNPTAVSLQQQYSPGYAVQTAVWPCSASYGPIETISTPDFGWRNR